MAKSLPSFDDGGLFDYIKVRKVLRIQRLWTAASRQGSYKSRLWRLLYVLPAGTSNLGAFPLFRAYR